MKKFIFGLFATVVFGFIGNAQKYTKEDVRLELSKNIVSLTNALKPAFKKGISFNEFENNVIGKTENTKEGNDLLKKVYEYLLKGTSENEILKNYSGSEMAAAALFINDANKSGSKSGELELFGGTTGDFNPYPSTIQGRTAAAPCKWYNFNCWMTQIFGESGGNTVTNGIIKFLLSLIAP